METIKEFAKDDFGKVVITVLGTLIVTGFGVWLGAAKDIFTDWWKRRRQTRYHAMLLAVTLDQLIDDCILSHSTMDIPIPSTSCIRLRQILRSNGHQPSTGH